MKSPPKTMTLAPNGGSQEQIFRKLRSTHSATNLLAIHASSQTNKCVRIINFAKAHCLGILHTDN